MSQQDHDYIIQTCKLSLQNLAEGAIIQQDTFTRLNVQFKSIQALAKILHRQRTSQQDRVNMIQNAH